MVSLLRPLWQRPTYEMSDCLGRSLAGLAPLRKGGGIFPMTNHLSLSGLSTVTEVPEIEGKSASHCCNFLLDLHFEPILIYGDGSSQS